MVAACAERSIIIPLNWGYHTKTAAAPIVIDGHIR